MMKKEYNAPVIRVKKVIMGSLLQNASMVINPGKQSDGSDASSKPSFTIWEFMEEE